MKLLLLTSSRLRASSFSFATCGFIFGVAYLQMGSGLFAKHHSQSQGAHGTAKLGGREIHSSSLVDGRAPSVALYTFNQLGTKSFSPLEVRYTDRTRDWEELSRRAN